MSADGVVDAIFLAKAGGAPRERVEAVRAVEGKGLEGDRYFGRPPRRMGGRLETRQVTLVEAEAVEDAARTAGRELGPGEARRNVVTRGVRLNGLVGREFRVGEAVLRGTELCDPCSHLGRFTWRGIVRDLENRGGLRAEVVRGGEIREGDAVVVREPESEARRP